jgi:hypothetical protein
MDRILKLVYSAWYNQFEVHKMPIPNGLPNVLVKHIQDSATENKTLAEVQQDIQSESETTVFVHDHSNFIGYHKRYCDESTIISVDEIADDNSIYLYPIEIRTVIHSLVNKMSFTLAGQQINYQFTDTIPTAVLSQLRTGKLKLLINYVHEPMATAEKQHFSMIESKMNALGICGSNIIVVAGSKFSHPSCKINFTDGGILMGQQMAAEMEFYPRKTGLGYYSDYVRESNLDKNKIRSKKFLCFNRTLKSHRFMIAYLALKYKLLDNNIFSFINPNGATVNAIYQHLKFYVDNNDNLEEIASTIHNLIPYEIDTQHLSVAAKRGFGNENSKKELYIDTYLHLTSETRFDSGDYPFFSEKTYRPLMNLQPFIHIGNHHSLEKLHQMGFRTFHPFINEDYDLEEDPRKRMSMIEKEIAIFNNKSITEIHDWYYSITDILLHNQQQLEKMKNINPYEKAYVDIKEMYE